ncbi:MAG: hypothetical protein Q4B22_04860 [Eubacteriales bacterium]|nr:hypothetical protein [Eubacteriales bacterium]
MVNSKWKKRIVCMLCSLFCLTLSAPLQVFAAGETESQQTAVESTDGSAGQQTTVESTAGSKGQQAGTDASGAQSSGNEQTDAGRVRFCGISEPNVDTGIRGSIRIHDRYGEGAKYNLYQVAVFDADGTAYYTDAWTGAKDKLTGLPDNLGTAANQEKLIDGLAKLITAQKMKAYTDPQQIDADKTVTFTGVEPGYYLVLTEAPERSDNKVYSASTILVSVPESTEADTDQNLYSVQIEAKSELKDKPKNTTPTPTPSTTPTPSGNNYRSSGGSGTPSGGSGTSSGKASERLPQTGVLWWPVPVLFTGGLFLYILGVILEQEKKKN